MTSKFDQDTVEEKSLSSIPAGNLHLMPAQMLLSGNGISHNPKSGLNPVADAAGTLFTLAGKLRQSQTFPDLQQVQSQLTAEMTTFFEAVKNHGYSTEYTLICRYIMCALLDEIMMSKQEEQWKPLALLAFFKQDLKHGERFFIILERIIKEPALYIDLMELMYLCLSLEYKGQYDGQQQLELITNSLYKHIRAHRGNYSKNLSPTPFKSHQTFLETRSKSKTSLKSIFIVTACIILTILISLGYLMDVISNESNNSVVYSGKKA